MQDRNLNDTKKQEKNIYLGILGAASSDFGVHTGMNAAKHAFAIKHPLSPFLLSTLFVGSAQLCITTILEYEVELTNKPKPKPQAPYLATLGAITAGASSLVGWSTTQYYMNKHLKNASFTYEMSQRAIKRAARGTILTGLVLPLAFDYAYDTYKKLQGPNFNENTNPVVLDVAKKNDVSVRNIISAQQEKYLWHSAISGTASIIGVFNGLSAADHLFFPKPPIPYSLATALIAGAGVYGVKRLFSTIADDNDGLCSKSEASTQATIAAISAGSSTLAGWIATRYNMDKHYHCTNFTHEMSIRAIKRTALGTVVAGFALPLLINKAHDQYTKLQGSTFKEKTNFLFFKEAEKNDKASVVEEKKNDVSSPRKK